jgi:hypothetical protein
MEQTFSRVALVLELVVKPGSYPLRQFAGNCFLRLRRPGSRWGRQPGLAVAVRSGLLMQP